MARPKKSTVDYFPHDTSHGSTMQILESRWGNNGYAFWFKLLELLGSHDSHFIDCRKPAEWEFLTAKTLQDDETAGSILQMLAKLEAIDSLLWSKHKVIFCPKFLNRIEDAYRKRKDSFPTVEKVYAALNINVEEFPAEETLLNVVSASGSTERERERESNKEHCSSGDELGSFETYKKRTVKGKRLETFLMFWDAFEYKAGKAKAADAWLDIPSLTKTDVEKIVTAARMEAQKRPQLLAKGTTPKMAQGWISERRWEDESMASAAPVQRYN